MELFFLFILLHALVVCAIDGLDLRIVEILAVDSRTAFLEVARRLKVSEGTVRKRVLAMLKRGEIKRFSLILGNGRGFGRLGVGAIVGVKTDPHTPTGKAALEISRIAGVKRVFEVAGNFDVFCIASAEGVSELNVVLEKIRKVKGVVGSESFTVLNEVDGNGN